MTERFLLIIILHGSSGTRSLLFRTPSYLIRVQHFLSVITIYVRALDEDWLLTIEEENLLPTMASANCTFLEWKHECLEGRHYDIRIMSVNYLLITQNRFLC